MPRPINSQNPDTSVRPTNKSPSTQQPHALNPSPSNKSGAKPGAKRQGKGSSSRGASSSSGSGTKATDRNAPEFWISKKLSWVLRHGAVKEGIKMDKGGFVNCAELLAWQPFRSISLTFPQLCEVVKTNDKQRYVLISDSFVVSPPAPTLSTTDAISPNAHPTYDSLDPAHHLIRASQGHSIPIASAGLLTPILHTDPSCPAEVVHGTFPATWPLIIASGGLKKMGRQHIHFAVAVPIAKQNNASANGGTPHAEKKVQVGQLAEEEADRGKEEGEAEVVISGMRKDASILIWVDLRRSLEEGGLKWWRSANGVVLTEGNEDGVVEMRWVRRVEHRRTGQVLWENAGGK